jgi:hypothetical protein
VNKPLCTEPWQSYYILRRGILPCCHGHAPIAPMSEWKSAWNSAAMREIRGALARGALSAYCLRSLSCPIVQRFMEEKRKASILAAFDPALRPPLLRAVNRALGGVPARIYRRLFANNK